MNRLMKFVRTGQSYLVILFICFSVSNVLSQSAPLGTEFCTTTTTSCNTISGCVDHTISVTGVGVLSPTNVLNAIHVNMGSAGCQGNLTAYDFTIIAPDGTTYKFIDNITSSSTAGWVNTTFMDNPNLERIRNDFSSSVQDDYNPWSIGYYKPNSGTGFSSLNGINADGNWIFRVCESVSGNMISFNSACLFFGSPVPVIDELGASNDICADAICIDNTTLMNADNIGTVGDPLYPGDLVDGCSWNSGNHQGSWFRFQPTGTTATITLSGLDGPVTNYPFQPIVLENALGDDCPSDPSDWLVPNGGCPNDETVNNQDYLPVNGGGAIPGDIYRNGIGFNTEFNLSGLTPNKVYYLFVDGNTSSVGEEFVIELSTSGAGQGPNGAISCATPLAAEMINFEVFCNNGRPELHWQTASEMNNDYFEVQHSEDGYNYYTIGIENSLGNSSTLQSYQYAVNDRQITEGYFRVKALDFDGTIDYSPIRQTSCSGDEFTAQFIDGKLVISNADKVTNCTIYDPTGRLIFDSPNSTSFDAALSSSIYFIQIETKNRVYSLRAFNP